MAPIFSVDRHHGADPRLGAQPARQDDADLLPDGSVLATKDEVPDPDEVSIVTRLNGQVMQDANTDDLVFSVAS